MNSKRIGGNYERDMSRILSYWFTGSEKELVVWRTAGSGNVGTVRKKKGLSGKNVDGDFQCLDSKYETFFQMFYMDSKSLSDVNFFVINLKNQKSNQLLNEWKKVVNDAGEKLAIMFVKLRKNRTIPDFVILHENIKVKGNNFIGVALEEIKYNFILLIQNDFFKCNSWEELIKFNKKN